MKVRRQKVLIILKEKYSLWGQQSSEHRYRLHPWKFFKPQQIKTRATLCEPNTDPTLSVKLDWRLPYKFTWIYLCFCDSSICHEVHRCSGSGKQEHKYLCLIWNQTWWKKLMWLCRKQSMRKAQWRQTGTSIMQVLGFLLRVSEHLICTRTECPKVCPRGVTCLQFAICCFPEAGAEMTQRIWKRSPLPQFHSPDLLLTTR